MTGPVRSAARRLAGFVAARPILVRFAARVFATFPSIKHRVRHLMAGRQAPASLREEEMSADQARVLADLREAARARGGSRR